VDQRYRNEKLITQFCQYVAAQGKVDCIESTRFSDPYFWHGGYDKADLRQKLPHSLSGKVLAEASPGCNLQVYSSQTARLVH